MAKTNKPKKNWFGIIFTALAFGLLLGFFVFTNHHYIGSISLIGDEHPYMAIGDSLATFHTFNLTQELQTQHYFNFFPIKSDLHAVHLVDGRAYPKHGIGWPILFAPLFFFAQDPRFLIMILQNIIVVLIAYNLFLWLRENRYGYWVSLFIPFVIVLTIPLSMQAHMVFSEPLAALCLLYGIRKLEKPNWLSLLSIIALPWIHIKYLAFFPILILSYLKINLKPLKVKILSKWPLIVIGLSILLLAFFNWYGYGTIFSAQEKMQSFFSSTEGLFGILIDTEDGLLTSAPIYLLAFLGLGSLYLKNRPLFWKIAYPVGILWLITGIFRNWGGGQAPTARMILVTLPLLAPALAESLVLPFKWFFRIIFTIILVPSLLLGLMSIRTPAMAIDKNLYPNLNQINRLFIPINLEKYFPGLHQFGWNLNLFWLIVFIALFILGYFLQKYLKKLNKIDETINHYPGI